MRRAIAEGRGRSSSLDITEAPKHITRAAAVEGLGPFKGGVRWSATFQVYTFAEGALYVFKGHERFKEFCEWQDHLRTVEKLAKESDTADF